MKPKLLLRTLMSLIAGILLVEANGLAQGFRTQQLLLDDDATSLPSRNTITLMAPSDGNLTSDYGLRFPNTTNLGVGSLLFVGATGTTNDLSWLAVGTTDQVLQVDAAGVPSWQTINLIPDGTTDNSTLRWDATASAWVENINMLSDAAGNTTINGATITTPNIPAGGAGENDVVVRNASNALVVRTFDDLLQEATLSQNAIWVGDASNNPAELAAGTTDQVLQIDATGAPTWQTINLIPDGTLDNTTLRWDATAGAWVENVNLLSDATGNTTVNGTATINGATTTINSATVEAPNIPAGNDGETDIVVRNASNALVVRTFDDLLSDATLSQNAIWVGDAANNPAELAAGTTDQVLQIDATGAPSWQTINLIPDGTLDNTTLRWDATAGAWVENVNLLSDASGNTTINGTTITTPNIPAGADGEIDIVIRNGSDALAVRTIDDLIGDATLSQNAIWVGDASNNPAEVAAGTQNQVLQIDATGAPTWQTINLAYRGRVATAGTLTQVIPDINVTPGAAVVVSYEDPANGARVAVDVIARTAGTDFTVGFSALPPTGSFINYTIIP